MKKSTEEVLAAASSIRSQAISLPDVNFFGDDNSEERDELLEWASQLELAVKGHAPTNEDVQDWLAGKPSALSDML